MKNKQKIIIDCDPGVDDFAALAFAIKSNLFNILGITTVNGNCSLKNATANALKTLEIVSKDKYKVYKGCDKTIGITTKDASDIHGDNGFGGINYKKSKQLPEKQNAVDFILDQANKYPGEIIIVAIGPLTNIASCILKDSDFCKKIKKIVIMGGAENTGNVLPSSEFNFYFDASAVDIVMKEKFEKIEIIDLDVTKKITLKSELEQFLMKHKDNELAKVWYDITRQGAEFDRKKVHVDGSIINDAVTIGYLINPKLLKMKNVDIVVSLNKKNYGHIDIIENKTSNIFISYDINVKQFLLLLFITIFPEYKKELKSIIKKIKLVL